MKRYARLLAMRPYARLLAISLCTRLLTKPSIKKLVGFFTTTYYCFLTKVTKSLTQKLLIKQEVQLIIYIFCLW